MVAAVMAIVRWRPQSCDLPPPPPPSLITVAAATTTLAPTTERPVVDAPCLCNIICRPSQHRGLVLEYNLVIEDYSLKLRGSNEHSLPHYF